jgi:hypothetical protein
MTNLTIPINYDLLRDTCLAEIDAFARPDFVTTVTPDGLMFYQDNGASILAVAHLDSVQDCKHFHKIDIKGQDYVLNASLDDRLGAYTILHLLPSLGLKYDILLTEGEEMGRSTAAHFIPPAGKKYKWMFSFDRRLDDVVMYQFDSKFGRKKLKSADFKIGDGSFSDIAFLDHLNCMGFNIGVGYDHEHSAWAIMDVSMYLSQIKKFIKFYNLYKNLHFRYTYKAPKYYTYTYVDKTTGATVTKSVQQMSRWDRSALGWGDEQDLDETYYKTHAWDTRAQRWVKNPAPADPPAGFDPEMHPTDYEICEVCGLPPKNPELAVSQGAMIVCETCIPYAASCDICGGIVRDDRIIDGACPDCSDAVNAYLNDDDDRDMPTIKGHRL